VPVDDSSSTVTRVDDAERASELAALRDAVRDLAGGAGGVGAARRRFEAAPGHDEQVWQLLGTEMGLAGLGIPEQLGGAGGGLAELTVVAEELGRSLLPVPFFSSTVVSGQLLTRCPATPAGIVADLASGSSLVAFAGVDADGCWRPDRTPVRAVHRDGWELDGTADFVLDGASAERLLVAASGPDGCDLYLVAGDAAGVRRRALETLDPSRSQASVVFTGAPATPLTTGGRGAAIVAAALDIALVVLAAEQVGGAAACLDMAVDYAKVRTQFSRPIGSFQAIKHTLAELLVLVEMGRSAIDRALLAEGDPATLADAASVAKVWCSEAFSAAATANVHINGGTGFTWEHDAHLYFRRSRADQVLLGDATVHRERLAALHAW
jgi:alkylation response protein AidB-like acyl-CoA dehydrogenase